MENEQLPAPAPASSSGGTAPTPASTAATRPPGPQISVYSGIPDRQTVQVIQQALHRQPNTAAQYLQQMYAAQQQHLMLQTAALQQQHLTSAQLQSLAAVQQASLAANRQSGSSGGNGAQPAPAQQPTINLATSPAAAQLLNRAQSVGPGASGIAQQAVLLGNAASPALTASQAQMYLRAQMPRIPGMTSGSGSAAATVAGAAPHNGENKPPQAIVKPQILTHVIEGFVIQEGAEPFPGQPPMGAVVWQVGRSSLLVGALHKQYAQELLPDKLPPQDNTTTTDSDMEEPYLQESKEEGNPPKLKCELCGRVDFAYKFKRSKRFCSMACAKRYNVGCTKRVGLFHPDRTKLQKPGGPPHGRRRSCKGTLPPLGKDSKKQLNHSQEDSSRCSDNSSYEEPLSPISASSSTSRRRQGERDLELRDMVELPDVHGRDLPGLGHRFLPSEPSKWNVEDVYEFIRSLPGCQEIAEEFRAQEIDGQALLLLKEDHLMSTMNIKLGPALKIYARINMLKDS
ncbi:Polyhomeotic-like protein 2 [Willisornis vidua]|uniref:Polyhomeotic-like protein 2 n=1 Tax=Willisornis vidua TaxID=1566151 RepID=A0ABQ9D2Y2_9PASS|nr:Polyhomeotic-like protein 2 [Willisornis vidua]